MDFKTKRTPTVGEMKRPAGVLGNPNFKAWFGNSKVVDAIRNPLVVYHGTQYSFDEFDPGMQGDTVFSADEGFFFTSDVMEANCYATYDWDRDSIAPNVMPVYLAIQNPLVVNISNPYHQAEAPGLWYDEYGRNMVTYAIDSGYDGLIISDFECGERKPEKTFSGKQTLYVAFDPRQIKSAIGNSGGFNPADARIAR